MIDTIIDRYIKIRDLKAAKDAAHKADVAKLDEALKKCEGIILTHLTNTGVNSVGSTAGTAFKSSVTSATVADWDATLGFIRKHGMWSMLDKRVNKTAVMEYRTENDDLPPGINWREETVVRVRRPD